MSQVWRMPRKGVIKLNSQIAQIIFESIYALYRIFFMCTVNRNYMCAFFNYSANGHCIHSANNLKQL